MFGIAALRLLPSINGVSSGLLQLRYGRDSVSRLYNDMKKMSSTKLINIDIADSKEVKFKNIELTNVSFAYPKTSNNVLNNITLKIKSRESVGIIGKSGSGKTTLVDLLLGLLEPQEGVITYNDDKTISSILHSQVAYLPQQVFLIDDSLRNNIAMDSHNISESKILNAIKKSKLLELVEKLPNGLDTIIGERGVKLSGGQRQRVALARAFYHERSILVMDESTSALDDETEREIVSEIERLKGDKTLIIIAHRLSTLRNCDVIYKIENGRIVNSGPYNRMVEHTS
jgi:ATP-binding cassette subfamily C protein